MSPTDRTPPRVRQARRLAAAAVATVAVTVMLTSACASSKPTTSSTASPAASTHPTYGWYASPSRSSDPTQAFVATAHTVLPGSERSILAIGHTICGQLHSQTITPVAEHLAHQHHIKPAAGEYLTSNAILYLCDPVHRSAADDDYLEAAGRIDLNFAGLPDLALHRGRDICYLITQSGTATAVTTTQRREHAGRTAASTLVTLAQHSFCPN